MQPNVILSQERLTTASFKFLDSEIVYDPYSVTQNGQQLDLTKNKCHLLPERLLLNFELIDPMLREHVKAWVAFACKGYANVSISNQFNLLKIFNLTANFNNQDDISELIDKQVRDHMESDKSVSGKSILRMIYGWFVEENFPFFDEDFFDLYLDTLRFGSDEGKGKDVIMELVNRGPLTLREQRLFREGMANINPHDLSIIELQGMVALKIGQVLGARDVQVIKLKFEHIGMKVGKAPFIFLPRAKQRGYKNNNQYKKRPITNSLFNLIMILKEKYQQALNTPIGDECFLLCTLKPRTGVPTEKRVTEVSFLTRRLKFESHMGLGFKVTNRRLRKTFCTQLIAKGAPLKVVAELMDHSDLQQLEVYYRHTHHIAKKLDEVLKSEASDILDAFKGKIITPDQTSQAGQQIFAPTRQQTLHLIGSCASKTPCSLNPPLSCYGCKSLEAFDDADHKGVVERFVEESKQTFGEEHAIEILKHGDFLAASQFVQKLERGEI
jgi:hypothetical protein